MKKTYTYVSTLPCSGGVKIFIDEHGDIKLV